MNGISKNLWLQLVHEVHGLKELGKESKEVFNSLVTLSKELYPEPQQEFTKFLAVQHVELMNEN